MIRTLTLFLTALSLSCCLNAQSAVSASFSLDSASFAAAAGRSGSASFTTDGVLGNAGPVGASSSPGYMFQGGPLSYLGIGAVPILLAARMTGAIDPAVRLEWSGNASNYTVYRGTNCATVGSQPVTTQTQNAFLDSSAAGETFVCYLIEQAAN